MLNLLARLITVLLVFVMCSVTLVPHRVVNREEYRLTETRGGQMTLLALVYRGSPWYVAR